MKVQNQAKYVLKKSRTAFAIAKVERAIAKWGAKVKSNKKIKIVFDSGCTNIIVADITSPKMTRLKKVSLLFITRYCLCLTELEILY